MFTFKLKLISSSLSVMMIQSLGIAVFREGNIIDLGEMQLHVVDACSGLRYVYPLLPITLLFAYLFHRRWWKRALVVLAAVPIAVFSNALRIAVTAILIDQVSPQAAEGFFHGFSGLLIFIVSMAFLMIWSGLLRIIQPGRRREETAQTEDRGLDVSRWDIKDIRLSSLWMASVLFLAFWGFNSALGSSLIRPERQRFEGVPTVMGDWRGQKVYLREEILSSLWADDYVQILFRNVRTGDTLILFVPYYEYQGTMHTVHSPVSCLVGGGFAPRSGRVLERNFPAPWGTAKIRQIIFEKDAQLLLSNYWFQQRGRIIASEYWNKWYLFWDSITQRRTDGALVRLEMQLREGQGVQAAQALLDAFTLELMKILPGYVPN